MPEHRDDTTVTSRDDDDIAAVVKRVIVPSPALILIWSASESHRVGESIVLEGPQPWVVGRDVNEPHVQLLAEHTPGRTRPGTALSSDAISRRQLEIDFDDDGELVITNVGKGPVRVNGARVEKGDEHPVETGDVIVIAGQYAFLVGERLRAQGPKIPYPTGHAFGEADAFGLVGESPAMWTLRERLAAAADARTHLLVLGETGVGKELAARAIHALSDRDDKKLVQRNASTLDEGVFDAEVFGCAKDFPNAGSPERKGLVGEADGGTLMLDEIGTIPNSRQAKLLTFLDAGSYFRVGDERQRRADVRVIGATNSSVGDLKNDLGPRFKVKVQVPPLAARREDIPLLTRHLVLSIAKTSETARRFTTEVKGRRDLRVSCALVTWLVQRSYPGNTRELEEVLRDAMFASPDDTIELMIDPEATNAAASEAEGDNALTEGSIRQALAKCGGNQTRAAEMLGLTSRYVLIREMKKFGIKPAPRSTIRGSRPRP
ncbi:MAG TPA: sigma 54-interacting transcriptional regulator [Polyangiaceae bacterium]|jgi:two-component system nitrogen regulation response regulator GlnG/two-component system response regulator HydG|nr:sigma 54-interacting transcriptional regulator [Polyangiaceae bacterium]